MYYGGAFSSFQGAAQAVWDTNYKGVWHLANGSPLNTGDSTLGATGTRQGAVLPSAVAGQVDGAAAFNGANDILETSSATANISGDISVEFWIQPTVMSAGMAYIHKDNQYSMALFPDGWAWGDSLNFSYSSFGHHNIGMSTNVWQHVAFTKTGGVVTIYRNGAS